MTKDQVTLIKESYLKEATRPDGSRSTAAEYMRFCLDGNIDFVTSKDCVVFDDANNMLHCICVNDDARSQAMYPVKIMSSDYGIIQQLEGIMSRQNFEDFVQTGFISKIISKDKADFLIKFARSIGNQAIQPKEAEPYYNTDPKIIPMHNTQIKREDSSSLNVSVKVVNNSDDIAAAVETATEGTVIMLDKNVSIVEPLALDKSIVLVSNGATVNAPIKVSGENTEVMIKGFNLTGQTENLKDTDKSSSIVEGKCKNLTIEGCDLSVIGGAYSTIRVECAGSVVIRGNRFSCANPDTIRNTIEFSQTIKCTNVIIEDNYFERSACENNCIGIYNIEDGAEIIIRNNTFEYSANAVRISDYTKSKNAKIQLIGNTYLDTIEGEYKGFLLFQGVEKNRDLSCLTVVIKDLTGPGNKVMKSNNDEQVWYCYGVKSNPTVIFG